MNLADSLRRQFAYDAWANQEVLIAIRDRASGNERVLQLMSHILGAERLWLERLKQQPQSIAVWPEPSLDWCQTEALELSRLWREYLELITVGDIWQMISYKNSKGEEYSSAISDILTHVVMHSVYHRGQIASQMRESGQSPAYTDFIHAIRQGYVK